jgi:hypothetical protein
MSVSSLTPLPPGYVGTLDDAQSKACPLFFVLFAGLLRHLAPDVVEFLGNRCTNTVGVPLQALAEFLKVADGTVIDEVKFRHETRETFSCRLLRARKFDVGEAKALLDKIVAWWRRENLPALIATDNDGALQACFALQLFGFVAILARPCHPCLEYWLNQNCYEDEVYPFYQHTWPALDGCFDKAGRPIYVEKTGKVCVCACMVCAAD